jgi:hypothetical protein
MRKNNNFDKQKTDIPLDIYSIGDFKGKNIPDLKKLNNLIIEIINNSNHFSRMKKRIVNTIEEQFERGKNIIIIRTGWSETGTTVIRILDHLPKYEVQYLLKKIIAEEYKLDLSGRQLVVEQ